MSYALPPRYPFTYTHSNQNATGLVESEMYFEGYAIYFEDEDTQAAVWEVEALLTGFAQFQNGKMVAHVEGIKSNNWKVSDLKKFEAACVDSATHQFKMKAA